MMRLTHLFFISSLQRAPRVRPPFPAVDVNARCAYHAMPNHHYHPTCTRGAAPSYSQTYVSRYSGQVSSPQRQGEVVAFDTRSQLQLERLGAGVGRVAQRGDVFLLRGVVGAGKTCFARGFIRGLLRDPSMVVTSPTYLLDNVYTTPEGLSVHHMDLYRLKDGADLSILGIPEVFETAISLIEWPERLAFPLPSKHYEVQIGVVPLEASAPVVDSSRRTRERFGRRTAITVVHGSGQGGNTAVDLAKIADQIRIAGSRALAKRSSYRQVMMDATNETERVA